MNLELAYRSIQNLLAALTAELPRLGGAFLIVIASLFVARALRWGVLRSVRGRFGHENLRVALGRLTYSAAVAVALLVAATVAFPSFTIGSLIQLLGVSGVVVGFAFKDIFQNFLAGVLILITNPFTIDDQIVVDSFEGTVVEIQARATIIRTYDHREVVVPNAELFTKSVIVNTKYEMRRAMVDLGIPADANIDQAQEVISAAMRAGVEGVEPDPVADVLVVRLEQARTTVRVLWWSSSRRADYLIVQDRVLRTIKASLAQAGIAVA